MTATTVGILKNLNVEGLKMLAHQAGPCATIQIPAYRPGSGDGSRLMNLRQLTHEAARQLRNLDRPEQAEGVIAEMDSLVATLPAEHGGPGVTLFCAPGFAAAYETPGVRELVTVGDHFYLLPHLATAQAPGEFFVLGLSQKHLRLLRYEYGRCSELPLPAGVPASLEAAGGFDKTDHNVEGRASGGPSSGGIRGIRFGVSADHDSEAEYLRHFFEAVDKGLKATLQGAPLFLAGVREEVNLYRKAAKYPNILAAEYHGNPEHSSLDQIARQAAAGVVHEYRAACGKVLAEFNEAPRKELTLAGVSKAAEEGRVRRLFVAEEPQPEQRAAVNNAVAEALRTGAEVYGSPGSGVEAYGAIAAELRY